MSKFREAGVKRACDASFRKIERQGWSLCYSDARLQTDRTNVLPRDTDVQSWLTPNILVNIPIISSPMDTVTGAEMAIAMAKEGGLGIIHKNLNPEGQAAAVEKVKRELTAFVANPVCVRANQTIGEVLERAQKENQQKFLSFPVLNTAGRVTGIVVRSDFDFCSNSNNKIGDIMSKNVIGAPQGTNVQQAYRLMMKHRIKILPVFNRQDELLGIYTLADVTRIIKGDSANFNLATDGALRVGAAIGVGDDARLRMELLAKVNVDVVVVDTAHGDSERVFDAVKYCKKNYPRIDLIAGNISQGASAKRLAKAGADGVRVGQGPGSICTTRIVAGVGCPQLTAVYLCAKALRGSGIPVCADGGITNSGDIPVAIAAGAHTVMLGRLLAGTTEAPGQVILRPDEKRVKVYRGMGSLGAMEDSRASRERYNQVGEDSGKLIPEGVEGEVPFKGDVSGVIVQLVGGLRDGMGYCGARTILDLQRKGDFDFYSPAAIRESHPHGLESFKKAPNYGD